MPFIPFLKKAKPMIEVLDLVTLLLLVPGMATVHHHGNTGNIGIYGYLIDPSMIGGIPATVTDSSNNDSSAIYVTITSVTRDIFEYRFAGYVTNVGPATISNVQVPVHLDDTNIEVGNTTQYIKPENIGVGQTATFDGFVTSDHLNAEPSSFWLSFDWS